VVNRKGRRHLPFEIPIKDYFPFSFLTRLWQMPNAIAKGNADPTYLSIPLPCQRKKRPIAASGSAVKANKTMQLKTVPAVTGLLMLIFLAI